MTKKQKSINYEQLGQAIASIAESGYADRKKLYKMSFIKGMLGGIGGVIGATVVVTLLLWTLSLFHHVPFVNRLTDNVKDTVEQGSKP